MNHLPSLHILDGAYFAHRAWHRKGRPPLENFVSFVLRLIDREQPSHFVVAWESEGNNFRHDLFPAYKAHRPPQEPPLIEHIARCREALEALGVPVVALDNLEGDDVAASFAAQWAETGHHAYVHTADKDLLQLVNERITVVIRGERYQREEVEKKTGVPPEQVADLLALAGDSADGIPGVAGIGTQTAASYLSVWKTADAIFENRHHFSDSKRQALWDAREMIPIFCTITRVRTDVELPIALNDTFFLPRLSTLHTFCSNHAIERLHRLTAYDDLRYELDERLAIMLESGIDPERAGSRAAEFVRTRHDPLKHLEDSILENP